MKKILLVALAAAAMVGCSQNEEIENISKNAEIKFVPVVKAGTKALITTDANFAKFTLFGYKTTDTMDENVQLSAGFIDKKEATLSNGWQLSDTFYWPATGTNVQFFATSPEQNLDVATNKGYPVFEYTVKPIGTQEDLIAAYTPDQAKTEKVLLAFKHLLTQVNISIKGDTKDFTYTVTEIAIKGAKDKGTFTFSKADSVGSWKDLDVTGIDLKYTGPVAVTPTDEGLTAVTQLEAANNALFMLIPQNLTGVVSFDITYSAAPKDKLSETTYNGTKNVKLTGTWGMSKNVRYTLVLKSDASAITLDTPQVGPWNSEEQGTIN